MFAEGQAHDLSDRARLLVAMEMNLSETTFVEKLPQTDEHETKWRIRWWVTVLMILFDVGAVHDVAVLERSSVSGNSGTIICIHFDFKFSMYNHAY